MFPIFRTLVPSRRTFTTTCLRLEAASSSSSTPAASPAAIRDQLKNALKTSMKAKKMDQTQIVKALMADIRYFEQSFSPPKDADDASVYTVIQKAMAQRTESAKQYLSAERKDLADKESSEADFIKQFLPTPLSSEEIRTILTRLVDSEKIVPGNVKEVGKLMKAFWGEVEKVKADGGLVGSIARELLMGTGGKK